MERQELLTKGAKAFISDDEDEEEGADASAQSKTHKRSEKVDRMRCDVGGNERVLLFEC